MFVASDGNTYNGTTPVGEQVAVNSFAMPGVLSVQTNPGNNVITISQTSTNSGFDVVLVNGVTVFTGPILSIADGIQIDPNNVGYPGEGVPPDIENDTLILDYSNGDPVPAGGVTFDAKPGGTNLIEVNADANETLSNDSLTIAGASGTDTIALANVGAAQLTGGPSNDTFTLSGWSGTTTITGGSGTNTLVLAAGTVNTSQLTVSNVQTLEIAPTTGTIFTDAGNGFTGYSGDSGLAPLATLDDPSGVAINAAGDLFIADSGNNVVREVTPAGIITTVAGTGAAGYTGDGGLATAATLNDPTGVAVDAAGDLFIADSGNNVIREVTPAGIITTIAGTGAAGYTGNGGLATNATLNDPTGVALDAKGDLFIADSGNNVIREVSGGNISTIAGTGTAGYTGDGGSATTATLNDPIGVAVDVHGDLFIADSGNNVIREVSGGTITTVAGSGTAGYTGDGGSATAATLNDPTGVAVDAKGDLFIADAGNNAIREVSGGTITTVAGTGTLGFTGDGGPATAATLDLPTGLVVSASGELFIADSGNSVVRAVTGATLDVNANFTLSNVQVLGPGVLELDNGVTLTANVVNSGTVTLGGSQVAGATIAGNYTQTTAGTLDIKLGGASAGQYDQLHVTGNASLAGTLNVSLVGDFNPGPGDSFQIITYLGTLAGDFTTENFPTLSNGNTLKTSSGGGSYTLTVTSTATT